MVSLKIIDPYNEYDLAFTYDLRIDNREFFFTSKGFSWRDHVAWIHQAHLIPKFDFYLIMSGDKRAGTIAVEHRESCEFLQNLCIATEFRGKGLARWAITQLMKPNRFIIAQVKPENKKVIKMYKELGFWQVKR